MVVTPETKRNQRVAGYAAVFVVLLAGRFLLQNVAWQGTTRLHANMELLAASTALFVGILALVRFYTKKNGAYLFIALGFLGAGFLDGYHALTTSIFHDGLIPFLEPAQPSWRWNASPTFLSILIAGSWLAGRNRGRTSLYRQRTHLLVMAIVLVCSAFFALVPLPPAPSPEYFIGRLEVGVSSVFFLIALLGYLEKGRWQTDPFEHWLVMSLIVSFMGQAIFMAFSRSLFDTMFDAAVLLKQISYVCVLTGLLVSIYSIFKQAEQAATGLASANEAMHREIAERMRAETAEHEQRQLAEALREVGIALSATLDFNELLDCLLDQIAPVLPYDTANVMLVKEDRVEIACTRGYGSHRLQMPRHFAMIRMPNLRQMKETGQPLVIPDTAAHAAWVEAEISPHVRSWAGAPITVQGQVIAFLALNNAEPGFYQPEDAVRLAAFSGQAAIAIQNARLYEEVQKRVEEQTVLNKISQAITSTLNLQETLSMITGHITEYLQVDATSVVLHDERRGDLWFAAASGQASDFVRGKRLAMGQGILGWVAQHGQPLLVPDVQRDERYFGDFDQKSGFTASSILCVPLQTKGQTIGAVETINKKSGPFEEEDLRLLIRLAGPAATAIENAQLYEQAQQEIAERRRVENALEGERALLARRVEERTADLRAANVELARAARMKDEFLASMSHELRTPLNAVLGMSEALQEEVYGPLNEKQLGSLHSIEESGRHLLELINDILDLSKIEAGKLELECTPVSVESVCQASLRLIRQNAHKKQLTIRSTLDSAVEVIWADERRLKQILVNLLSNAVKFTPQGGQVGLEVTGDQVGDGAPGAVRIAVWDTGIGISPEDMTRLFRPFVQLDSSLSREYAGTGLGLSLVYRMVELHGGSVSVASEVNVGSRFTVSLPWQEPAGAHRPARWSPAAANSGPISRATNRETTAGQSLILLAEDNEANVETLSGYLEVKGYRVMVAHDGREALELAQQERPDVILMDIQMPGMDGLEAMRHIRRDGRLADVPIIALTALAMPGDREACLAAGANAYLSKPVNLKGLVEAIELYLAIDPARSLEG